MTEDGMFCNPVPIPYWIRFREWASIAIGARLSGESGPHTADGKLRYGWGFAAPHAVSRTGNRLHMGTFFWRPLWADRYELRERET